MTCRRLSFVALASLVLFGCSTTTGGTGGVYYVYGGALARLISESVPGVEATAEVTSASIDNLKFLRDGKADIGFTLADTLKDASEGFYRNGFGAAAYFLLPSLDPKRRSDETTGRIGVLSEKFSKYPKDHFLRSGSRGGMVRSPLGNSAIERMSDKQWLRLVRNHEIPSRDGETNFRRYGKASVRRRCQLC